VEFGMGFLRSDRSRASSESQSIEVLYGSTVVTAKNPDMADVLFAGLRLAESQRKKAKCMTVLLEVSMQPEFHD
jgi:hypothetical protein